MAGFVEDALRSADLVLLVIAPDLGRYPVVEAVFPLSFRDQVYGMQRGDLVTVTGLICEASSYTRIKVDGQALELTQPRELV